MHARLVVSVVVAGLLASPNPLLAAPPNTVVFLVDDMGVMDTSVPFLTGQDGTPRRYPLNDYYRTPSMERLAAAGIRFGHFEAMSVCSPTRISIGRGTLSALRPGPGSLRVDGCRLRAAGSASRDDAGACDEPGAARRGLSGRPAGPADEAGPPVSRPLARIIHESPRSVNNAPHVSRWSGGETAMWGASSQSHRPDRSAGQLTTDS